jgi:hypothetical protein
VIPEELLRRMVWKIQTTRGLEGCIVGLYAAQSCRVIGHPSCVTPNSENVAVVIEEILLPASDTTLSPARGASAPNVDAQEFVKNRTKLGPELVGAGLSCSLAFISGLGVLGSLAAEVPTAGTSTFVLVASWTGFVTGAIQCANGAVRVGSALTHLDGNSLDLMDQNKKYQVAMLLVDAIGVASAVTALPYAIGKMWAVFTRLRAFNAARLSFDALRRMNRLQRLQAISSVFEDSTKSGEGVVEIVTAAKEAQLAARTMQRASGISVNHAATLYRIVEQETVRQLQASIKEVVASMSGLAVSATPAALTGSGSGSLNWIINILDAGRPAA